MAGWIQIILALTGAILIALLYVSILPIIGPAFRKHWLFGVLVVIVPIVGGVWLFLRDNDRSLEFEENLMALVLLGGYVWMVVALSLQALIEAGIL
jgi:hypothetical protein